MQVIYFPNLICTIKTIALLAVLPLTFACKICRSVSPPVESLNRGRSYALMHRQSACKNKGKKENVF